MKWFTLVLLIGNLLFFSGLFTWIGVYLTKDQEYLNWKKWSDPQNCSIAKVQILSPDINEPNFFDSSFFVSNLTFRNCILNASFELKTLETSLNYIPSPARGDSLLITCRKDVPLCVTRDDLTPASFKSFLVLMIVFVPLCYFLLLFLLPFMLYNVILKNHPCLEAQVRCCKRGKDGYESLSDDYE
jgi:hypothetical protein